MSQLVVSVPTQAEFNYVSQFDVEPVLWQVDSPPPRGDLDLVVAPYVFNPIKLRHLEGLKPRLIQLASIGFDGIAENAPAGLTIANAATVHETATAELTMALILAAQRGLPRMVQSQQRHEWDRFRVAGLADSTVLIVGVGGVGTAIADRLEPFEVTIVRVASRERDDEHGHIYSTAQLPELLPSADIVVLAVPLSDSTRHLANDAFFAQMRDGALFVNISRGKVADTEALSAAAGRIRVALDVVDPEPLPAASPLWDNPAVLIAPHLGGWSAAQYPRHNALIGRQIGHLLAGEVPENVVLES